MKITGQVAKSLIALYAIAVVGSASWAWVAYLGTTDPETEQLLPAFIFGLMSLPSSLLMGQLVAWYPDLVDRPLLQYSLMTLLGFLQVACLAFFVVGFSRFRSDR